MKNQELGRLLKARRMSVVELARQIHPEGGDTSNAHLSQVLNGKRSLFRGKTARLTATWQRLKRVMTAKEWEVALAFVMSVRKDDVSGESPLAVERRKVLTGGIAP